MRGLAVAVLAFLGCVGASVPEQPPRVDDSTPEPVRPNPPAPVRPDAAAEPDGASPPDATLAADVARPPADAQPEVAAAATDAKPMKPIAAPTGPMCFGADCDGANPFPGQLDRVRLYNRPLRPEEVAAHTRRQYEPCAGDRSCVGEWTFDEPPVNGAFPSTGDTALPAKIVGQLAQADGPDGKSLRLDGKGRLEVPNGPSLKLGSAFTFEVWVLRTACPADFPGPVKCRFMRMVDLTGAFKIEHHAGGQTMRAPSSGYIGDPWSPTGRWSHITFVFDAQRTQFQFYVDGKPANKLQRW